MVEKKQNPLSPIKVSRVIYPVLIGFGVVGFMLYKERNFDVHSLDAIHLTFVTVLTLFASLLMMAFRDIGYMIRIRILTDNQLTWIKAFRVIMLWEFTSTIMPSAVGGSTVAMIYVNKEGISFGRSTAAVMVTSFLDELYFVIGFPLVCLLIRFNELFSIQGKAVATFANEFFYFAIIGYGLKFIYTIFLGYGIFVNPRGLKWLLLKIFKLPFIRKWKHNANETGTDIIKSSVEYRHKPFLFWLKAFGATIIAWTCRYWVVNIIFLAFFAVKNNFLLFARQLVMWNMMLVSPTPGGSGFAEFVFIRYLGQFVPSGMTSIAIIISLAFIWRLISYYPYLIIGSIIFPKWAKKHFSKNNVAPKDDETKRKKLKFNTPKTNLL
jgi:glycosyltransferase 2 family protein